MNARAWFYGTSFHGNLRYAAPEPQTFREPDRLPEPVPAPVFCCWRFCSAVVHEDEGVGCESCGGAAHRDCALPLDEADGTYVCNACAVLVAKED